MAKVRMQLNAQKLKQLGGGAGLAALSRGLPANFQFDHIRTEMATDTPATRAHRLIVSPSARIKNVTPQQIVDDALQHTAVPGARATVR